MQRLMLILSIDLFYTAFYIVLVRVLMIFALHYTFLVLSGVIAVIIVAVFLPEALSSLNF